MDKVFKSKYFLYIIFLLGFLIMTYPLISQRYYRIQASNEIASYDSKVKDLDDAEIKNKIKLAQAYNSTLDPSLLSEPFSEEEKRAGRKEYARMLEVNEKIGYIEVPKIGEKIPIYAGTSENVLQKGAGHLEGTSLPVGGIGTHSVITAHRGLPTAKLFTNLDKMEKGDLFFIHVLDKILSYKVDQILTVEPYNFEPVLVVEGKDYSTLLTCTPYMINSHRLLVRGERIDYHPPVEEKDLEGRMVDISYGLYLTITIVIIIVLALVMIKSELSIRSLKKKEERGEDDDKKE